MVMRGVVYASIAGARTTIRVNQINVKQLQQVVPLLLVSRKANAVVGIPSFCVCTNTCSDLVIVIGAVHFAGRRGALSIVANCSWSSAVGSYFFVQYALCSDL